MQHVSAATVRNWARLNTTSDGRLAMRANKMASMRRIKACGYLRDERADRLLEQIDDCKASVYDVMYSLCVAALRQHGILDKTHVRSFLETLKPGSLLAFDLPESFLCLNNDTLGFIYQSILGEGKRNTGGVYYTPNAVVHYLVAHSPAKYSGTILDPCCGSGAFLLGIDSDAPERLFGFDTDPIAVMIASTNLLTKYANNVFTPQIFQFDFLDKGLMNCADYPQIPNRFDFIYTNPPWGVDRSGLYSGQFPDIKTKERASMVVKESLEYLASGGHGCFVLPMSILNVAAHSDVRRIMLNTASIDRIHMFNERFDGVFTRFFAIELTKSTPERQKYSVFLPDENECVDITPSSAEIEAGELPVVPTDDIARAIIEKMDLMKHDNLGHSCWALGIVTGDNKHKLMANPAENSEPIYMGKQVLPFGLSLPTHHVIFKPEEFQQCAAEDLYRAPEKLIYRFIAKYPVVAYDNRQCLCLNSANIVIPHLDSVSVKSAAALLNSSLYRFYYSTKNRDIKVLKRSLTALPFPKLTPVENDTLEHIADEIILNGLSDSYRKVLDEEVFDIFDLSQSERTYVINFCHR